MFVLIVVLLLFFILLSLGSGMVFLIKDRGRSTRTLNALTIRILLSISLFILLIVGYKMGWIQPHGPFLVEKQAPPQIKKALP